MRYAALLLLLAGCATTRPRETPMDQALQLCAGKVFIDDACIRALNLGLAEAAKVDNSTNYMLGAGKAVYGATTITVEH